MAKKNSTEVNWIMYISMKVKCAETQGVIKMSKLQIMWPFLGVLQEFSFLDKSQEGECTTQLCEQKTINIQANIFS